MKLKVLFILSLCLFTASIICNTAMLTIDTTNGWRYKAFTNIERDVQLSSIGIEPMGDPIGDGPWPMSVP